MHGDDRKSGRKNKISSYFFSSLLILLPARIASEVDSLKTKSQKMPKAKRIEGELSILQTVWVTTHRCLTAEHISSQKSRLNTMEQFPRKSPSSSARSSCNQKWMNLISSSQSSSWGSIQRLSLRVKWTLFKMQPRCDCYPTKCMTRSPIRFTVVCAKKIEPLWWSLLSAIKTQDRSYSYDLIQELTIIFEEVSYGSINSRVWLSSPPLHATS